MIVLAFAGPQRGEPTIKRRDQAIQVSLFGFQCANLGSQPRHRPKPDNLLAFHAGSQLHAAAYEVAGDLFPLVGKDAPEVCRLRGIRRAGSANHPLPNSHCGNLTVPLDGCQPGHRFFCGWWWGHTSRPRSVTSAGPGRRAAGLSQTVDAAGWSKLAEISVD